MFYREQAQIAPTHSLQTCDSAEVITSTTILRDVVENKLQKAGTPHTEDPDRAPLLKDDLCVFASVDTEYRHCLRITCGGDRRLGMVTHPYPFCAVATIYDLSALSTILAFRQCLILITLMHGRCVACMLFVYSVKMAFLLYFINV